MRSKILLFLFLSVNCFSQLVEFSEPPTKHYSLEGYPQIEAGGILAKEQNKPLLIVFLGTDWCVWSKKFYEDVLENQMIAKDLPEVVVAIENFPEEANGRVEELKEKYLLQELPTFLLLSPEGEKISTFGYLPWKDKEFTGYIHKLVSSFREIATTGAEFDEKRYEELYVKAKELGWEEKINEILHKGVRFSKTPFFLVEKYASILEASSKVSPEAEALKEKIIALDPKNQQGALLQLALIDFNMLGKNKKKDPKKVIAPLVEYLQKFGKKDQDNIWKVEWMIGKFLFTKDRGKEALEHIKASYQAAPEYARQEIKDTLDYMEKNQAASKS